MDQRPAGNVNKLLNPRREKIDRRSRKIVRVSGRRTRLRQEESWGGEGRGRENEKVYIQREKEATTGEL